MILATWNFKYALQLQSTKTILFCYVRHQMRFIDAFCYSKIHFHLSRPFELIKTMLKSLHILLGSGISLGF